MSADVSFSKKLQQKDGKKVKIINTVGKRKVAVARAAARKGKGRILINSRVLDSYPEIQRLMIMEPLILAGDFSDTLDISVNVKGGGVMGQAEATRQAIAKALVAFKKDLKKKFVEYDRLLLVSDDRRTESHKPSSSKKGPRHHKQLSKR